MSKTIDVHTDKLEKDEFDSYFHYGDMLILGRGKTKKKSLEDLTTTIKKEIKMLEEQINFIKEIK